MDNASPPFRGMSLKRPCKHCPFRTDVPRFLHPQRYREIAAALVDAGESFICHETLEFDDNADRLMHTETSRSCAGAMIWLQHQERPNQVMQVMARLGAFDPARLDMDASVYRSRREFEDGQQKACGRDLPSALKRSR